jgi:hypothetical protein
VSKFRQRGLRHANARSVIYANGLASRRSRIIGRHFFMTAFCSVTSMRASPFHMTTSINATSDDPETCVLRNESSTGLERSN